jgi:hypothetical protein
MDDRQHLLKRKILILRIVAAIIVIPLGVFLDVFKTVYPHNHNQGPIALVVVAVVLGVAIPIRHRISRIKTELASLG